jgi:mannonate dehydratase
MKLGLGLYRHMLTRENFQFARQAGATHVVVHLVDYFRGGAHHPRDNQPTGTDHGWGLAGDPEKLWSLDELMALRREVEAAGLKIEAIENLDPAHWHDVLLDGPKRALHIENVKTILRRLGHAGIPILGYNFSLAGVAGRTTGPYARGKAPSVGMEGPCELPMPRGMVWNMVYDPDAPAGAQPPVAPEELWRRLERFLNEVLPVAEEAGVKLALHPDDPLAEMTEGDIYETVDRYSRQGRLGYVHLRNVTGKVPRYRETFIDDGDVDIMRVLQILHRNGFEGVLIPDHTPQMACGAPWHAGMAYAMGYIRAALRSLGAE